jgi:hypothetical protein
MAGEEGRNLRRAHAVAAGEAPRDVVLEHAVVEHARHEGGRGQVMPLVGQSQRAAQEGIAGADIPGVMGDGRSVLDVAAGLCSRKEM